MSGPNSSLVKARVDCPVHCSMLIERSCVLYALDASTFSQLPASTEQNDQCLGTTAPLLKASLPESESNLSYRLM